MAMTKSITERLEDVSKVVPYKERVSLLQKKAVVAGPVFVQLLYYIYDPNVEWLIPEGPAPYKPNNLVDQEGYIFLEEAQRKLANFVGGDRNSPRNKKQARASVESKEGAMRVQGNYIAFLEALDKADAKLVDEGRVNRRIKMKNITEKLVRDAFPGLLSEPKKDG